MQIDKHEFWLAMLLAGVLSLGACSAPGEKADPPVTLRNVSYDPTREFY
jgi:ABC-type sulfate transport system substrate-binding protein